MPRKAQNILINAKIVFRTGDQVFYYYHPRAHLYDLPGGHLEWGESPVSALRREIKEEFGYTLKGEPTLLAVTSYVPNEKNYHRIRIVYTITLPKPVDFRWTENKTVIEPHWVSRKQLASARLPHHLKTLLIAALK